MSPENLAKLCEDKKDQKPKEKIQVPAIIDFKIDEVVWCHLKGFPTWPAKILEIYGKKNQMVRLFWFNDYRSTSVHKGQLLKFGNYNYQSSGNISLDTAIKEALIYKISRK